MAFSLQAQAQVKYEKESRLNAKLVPTTALAFIEALPIEKKIRWYLEEGLDRTSIEAKFKMNGQKYSIEFDSAGTLEDVEIQVEWETLNRVLKDSFNNQLDQDCKAFHIRKTQIQYTGNQADLLSKLTVPEAHQNQVTRYEIIIKCRSENSVDLFEYLFSATGQKLKADQIVFKNSSHLEY
ncbi:MAG: hypothetical protein AAF598_07070 [Bacteroidota bacterium]